MLVITPNDCKSYYTTIYGVYATLAALQCMLLHFDTAVVYIHPSRTDICHHPIQFYIHSWNHSPNPGMTKKKSDTSRWATSTWCCTWRYIKHVVTCIQLQAIPVSTIAASIYFTSTHSSTTYWQFAITEYVLKQQLYFSNKYKYTHKASAIILTRVGTAFINLCPTSVSSPSWCTITLVTIHHVLDVTKLWCNCVVSFMSSTTTWKLYILTNSLWITFSITSVHDTKNNSPWGWLGLDCETRRFLCVYSQCSCLHSHRGRGSSHCGWFHT